MHYSVKKINVTAYVRRSKVTTATQEYEQHPSKKELSRLLGLLEAIRPALHYPVEKNKRLAQLHQQGDTLQLTAEIQHIICSAKQT